MKRSGYKKVITLLIVQAVLLLSATLYASEIKKEFNKEFQTQGKDLLTIDNRYGDVTIENWNENRVVIDVFVTIDHPNNEKSEKLLSMIEVEFIEDGTTIGAKTIVDSKFSLWGGGSDHRYSIDYVVKMPTSFNLDLINRYGSVDINELSGRVSITVKYGTLLVDKLSRGKEKPLNKISLAYSKADIEELGWSELYLRYSGRTSIGRARALMVDSRYSKLEIEGVGSIVLDSKYDNINISSLRNLVSESGYTTYRIGRVDGKLDVETGYGSFEVEKLSSRFESVDVTTKYCTVKIGVEETASYILNASAQYGGISFNEDKADLKTRIEENNSKRIEAIVGDKNATSKIDIKTSYGSIKVY
jgi:hypothetical protein